MSQNDIEQLATFMGHTGNIHKKVYRLPDDVYQTAKISKLLMLMEKGEAGAYKGKRLDEIDINLEEEIVVNENEDADSVSEHEGIEEHSVESTVSEQFRPPSEVRDVPSSAYNIASCSITKKKKRVLIPWTTEQKQLTKMFFKNHIKNKIPPKKDECEQLQTLHAIIFHNKTWPQIKVFVQNAYKKTVESLRLFVFEHFSFLLYLRIDY